MRWSRNRFTMNVFTEPVRGVAMSTRKAAQKATSVKIMRAADELFAAVGFEATTIRDIASRAGVSVGSVMNVGDKTALLVASFDSHIADLHQVKPWLDKREEARGLERVDVIYDTFVDVFFANAALARAYGAALVSGAKRSVIFLELADTMISEVAGELEALGVADSRRVAASIHFAFMGRLFSWPLERDHEIAAVKADVHGFIRVIARGAGAGVAGSDGPARQPAARARSGVSTDGRAGSGAGAGT